MIIDLNILKRLGKRFGVFPISAGPQPLQAALQKPEVVFIKAPAGIEPAFTGGGYQWGDAINGYLLGFNQKLFLTHDGTVIWTFKDVLFRGLSLDSVQKWTSGDAEYPMGKANAFFIVYGKLTGQDLGEGETAGDNVPDGETEPGEGGGLATADDENAPPYSKDDIQKMLKGEFPADAPAGPKASMDTAIPDEPSSPMSGPPPSRLAKGAPPVEGGSEAEKIIATLYKKAHINPNQKLNKQNPIRLDSDEIIDLYQRAKQMEPEEGEKLIAFLKSGAILPLEEGKIAKSQLNGLLEHIVSGIVDEVERAKEKAKAKREEPHDDSGDKLVNTLRNWNPETPDTYNPDDSVRKAVRNWKSEGKSKDKKKVSKSVSKPACDKEKCPTCGLPDISGGKSEHAKWCRKEHHWHPGEGKSDYSQMDWDAKGQSHFGMAVDKPDYKNWVVQVANKLWKDPMDIGKDNYSTSWQLNKVIPHETGEYYQLKKEKTVHLNRTFVHRNNKWYYLNPDPNDRRWIELGKEHPMDEPSIEQEDKRKWTVPLKGQHEDDQIKEMTTSAAAGPYSIPGAFGRKMSHRKDHIEVLGYKMTPQGEEEYKRPADKLYEAIKSQVEKLVKEGNFDGLRSPYIPGGTEPLQQEESGLGSDFDKAQRSYDARMPEEDDIMIDCGKCGEPEAARITKKGSKGSHWWWEAVCTKCGQTFGNDNF